MSSDRAYRAYIKTLDDVNRETREASSDTEYVGRVIEGARRIDQAMKTYELERRIERLREEFRRE